MNEFTLNPRRKLVMERLWTRLGEIFGNPWELNFGKVGGSAFDTWAEGLANYSEQQLAHGIRQAATWDSGFVPNLGQFCKLCLSAKPQETIEAEQRIARDSEIKSLEDFTKRKRTDSPIAAREKDRMRRILAGEDIESKDESYKKLKLHARWGAR